jgi:hypothetical protein
MPAPQSSILTSEQILVQDLGFGEGVGVQGLADASAIRVMRRIRDFIVKNRVEGG